MDLKQLRYFTTIVDEGGVRSASKVLHISQPALTVAIKNLETELGVSIFHRTKRRLEPTKEGYHLYKQARILLGQANIIKQDMKSLTSLEKAEINIGAPALTANYILSRPISEYMAKNLGVRIHFHQMSSSQTEKSIINGDIDLGFFTRPPTTDDIENEVLYKTDLAVFMRKGHPLEQNTCISWLDVFDYPIVTLPKEYQLYDMILNKEKFYKKSADITLATDCFPLIKSIINQSDAIGLLIKAVADHEKELVSKTFSHLKPSGNEKSHIHILSNHLKNMPLSIAAKSLLQHLREDSEEQRISE